MLLCTQCSDSRWKVSQEASGVHLTCSAVRRYESKMGDYIFGICGHTVVLPHYTAVIPTSR